MSDTSNFGTSGEHALRPKLLARSAKFGLVRYSLLGLLALIGVLVLACGWPQKAKELKREREAVAEIERLGGIVRWDWQCTKDPNPQPPGPEWLKRWLGDNCLATVESIGATKRFGDEGLKHLKDLRELHALRLSESAVTDDGLRNLEHVKGLRSLVLARTQITDAALKPIEGLNHLEWLNLDDTKVTDAGLKHIAHITNLGHLFLNGTQITDAGLQQLKALTRLSMLGCTKTKVTREGADKLKQALPDCMIVP